MYKSVANYVQKINLYIIIFCSNLFLEVKYMIKTESKEILMKNNALVKARYDINPYENKLFILILHRLQKINDTTCKCSIKASEIKNRINSRSVRHRKEIINLLSSLRSRPIYFRDCKNRWAEYGFINGFKLDENDETFVIESSKEVHALLVSYLEDGYTPVNLEIWLSLKSSYSQRLYDLLRLWSGTKKVINYSLSELKELLMLENKYPLYAEFKRRVLEPARKELNSTGKFIIDIKENKLGRKVDSIDFIVKDLDDRVYFDKSDSPKDMSDTVYMDINKDDKSKSDFYIPNKKLFTTKTLSDFTNNFKNIDFRDTKYKKLLQDAIMITLEKDNTEKIYAKSYNYFKKTLENKLYDLSKKENQSNLKKTKFHNFDETFTHYS